MNNRTLAGNGTDEYDTSLNTMQYGICNACIIQAACKVIYDLFNLISVIKIVLA